MQVAILVPLDVAAGMHFASVGAYILVITSIAVGLFLATDYVLLRMSAWFIWSSLQPMLWAGRVAKNTVGSRHDDIDEYEDDEYLDEDEYEEYEEVEDGEGPAVVMPGQTEEPEEEEEVVPVANAGNETDEEQSGEDER